MKPILAYLITLLLFGCAERKRTDVKMAFLIHEPSIPRITKGVSYCDKPTWNYFSGQQTQFSWLHLGKAHYSLPARCLMSPTSVSETSCWPVKHKRKKNFAPLRIMSGALQTVRNVLEFDGKDKYFTDSDGVRYKLVPECGWGVGQYDPDMSNATLGSLQKRMDSIAASYETTRSDAGPITITGIDNREAFHAMLRSVTDTTHIHAWVPTCFGKDNQYVCIYCFKDTIVTPQLPRTHEPPPL